MSKINGDISNSQKPYVRYRISSDDIKDKGIGFAAKKSITSFMKSHGISCRFSELEAEENRFDVVLEIFDSRPDYNVFALLEHLGASGRLPDKNKLKPSFKVVPLPCDHYLDTVKDDKSNISWQKTVEDLEAKLRESQESVDDLTRSLGERQKVIDEQSIRVKTLGGSLEAYQEGEVTNPVEFMIESYFRRESMALFEAGTDYEDIFGKVKYELLVSNTKNELSLLEFIEGNSGKKFGSEFEYHQWIKEVKERGEVFEESPDVKDIVKSRNEIEANRKVLEIALGNGASQEVINAVQSEVDKATDKYTILKKKIENLKKYFDEDRLYFNIIGDGMINYEIFNQVLQRSQDRRKNNSKLFVITRIKKNDNSVKFYVPSFDKASGLERQMYQAISSYLIPRDGGYTLESSPYGDNATILEISKKQIKNKKIDSDINEIQENIYKNTPEFEKEGLFNALGISPKVIMVIESS